MRSLIRWFKQRDDRELLQIMYVDSRTLDVTWRDPCWRIEPVIDWCDFWVGVYVDREKRRVYVLPLPCLGFRFYWG
jgi:hypothetical protein